ncbi:MAG: HAMP domain-containing protein [Thermaceae bacterium]|nr:HAMP domain-containing protein [Thermaceae bacterium]
MKWWKRIEVRLALLMTLVAVFTNIITFGVADYLNQQRFKELPGEVRDFLLRENTHPLPFDFSVQLEQRLASGKELAVRLLPLDSSGKITLLLRPLEGPNSPVERFVTTPPPPHEGSFRARLQQGLLIGTLISVGLGILLALIFARRLAGPLEVISRAAGRLAEGDLSARIDRVRGEDEVALLARNFNHMAASLEGLESERKAMIADIAHELRTPLTIMQGRLEAIQDGVARLEMGEIDRLHNQAKLLSRLVEDLRTLSLADAGKLTLLRRPLDLREVIESEVGSFQAQAAAKQVRLETQLPVQSLTLKGDPDRLTQVIGNLLANALTHTPPGGTVRLLAQQQGQQLIMKVQDTGPGIAPEALSKVFDRFYRTEGSRSRQTGGSGLGLSIVKALVELHGGKIKAANRSTGGAEFEVNLPLGSTDGASRKTTTALG